METIKETEKVSLKETIIDWAKFIAQLAIILIILKNTIGFTRISGVSMESTIKNGSILLVNRFSAHLGKPKYGDVVVVRREGVGYNIVKRVIGLPGDTISIDSGVVKVNGNSIVEEAYIQGKSNDMGEVKVEDNKVFLLGDNRTPGESLDSRSAKVGTVPISAIKGYVVFSVYPFGKVFKP